MNQKASRDPEFVGEIFGSFLLLSKLAQGGMAAVYFARPAEASANGRILIVKRILPQVADDPEFLKMFRTEIRVCMGFSHPNIVQIYDFGQVAHQPYIAMEYVEGKNLRQILNHFGRKGEKIPVGVAVSIAAQAAAGLHHAHTFCNRVTGEEMNVIHRDISPQNILLSYDGNVKVIDFGIAKAVIEDGEETRTGSIKGKVSYLSPEQARREPLDARSDIFSLGAVLWELLTGRKLFAPHEHHEFDVVDKIKQYKGGIQPPSSVNPEVPKQLDDIVLKALSASRHERYQTAGDFQRALRTFLVLSMPGFGYADVAKCIRASYEGEIREETELLKKLNQHGQKHLEEKQTHDVTRVSGTADLDLGGQPAQMVALAPVVHYATHQPKSLEFTGSFNLVGLASGGAAVVRGGTPWFKVTRLRVLGALLYLSTIWFLKVDREYMFFERLTVPSRVVRMASMDPPENYVPTPRTPREVMLHLDIQPETPGIPTAIFVNNQRIEAKDRVVKVPLDRKVQVRVERKNWMPYKNEFILRSSTASATNQFKLDVRLRARAQ
jgi:eukaryotic-like serine/threonine-protein kinase